MNPNYFTPIPASKFICEKCDFKCCKKSDFERHLLTNKHKPQINPNDLTPKNSMRFCLLKLIM